MVVKLLIVIINETEMAGRKWQSTLESVKNIFLCNFYAIIWAVRAIITQPKMTILS